MKRALWAWLAHTIYLDNLICKLQVLRVRQGRRKGERERNSTGQRPWVNTYCHAPASRHSLYPFAMLLSGIQLDNQTHKQKAPKTEKSAHSTKGSSMKTSSLDMEPKPKLGLVSGLGLGLEQVSLALLLLTFTFRECN